MTRFPTAARLASRAGLAPVSRQSGPRARKPAKGHGDHWLKGYCTQAALGASRTVPSSASATAAPPAASAPSGPGAPSPGPSSPSPGTS